MEVDLSKADFSGWATKNEYLCSDGRTIKQDAFKHQNMTKVPLVYMHGHTDPQNVLGHAYLENREEGVYCHAFFNSSENAKAQKEAVIHGDIVSLSIWANQIVERSKQVYHGVIREVSLVLSGANPGARIENVMVAHGDGVEFEAENEVLIWSGEEIVVEHSDVNEDASDEEISHAEDDDLTIQDVIDTMDEKQRNVLNYLVGTAAAAAAEEDDEDPATKPEVKHDNLGDNATQEEGKTTDMGHNVFSNDATDSNKETLSHSQMAEIFAIAKKNEINLSDAVDKYSITHGIEDIDIMFPDAVAIDNAPEWIARRTEWVGAFLGAARKTPFSRIKTFSADITLEDARAKGYVKGAMKKEEFFAVKGRTTTPTTVYKKQGLDRDDLIDITSFDVVAWLKGEMRLMLDEEVARAALVGDGREVEDEDKISEAHIRPIAKDHELYTTQVYTNIGGANLSIQNFIDNVVETRHMYKGTGLPNMYTSELYIAKFLLLKDQVGRRIYKSLSDLATELRVSEIIPVEVLEEDDDIIAILVNPVDYVFGATAGGEVNLFDDFDIDFNKYKYLIETRICGALVKMKSAIVYRRADDSDELVVPAEPLFDPETGALTIVNTTGVVYKNGLGVTINAAGSPYTVPAGETYTVIATPATGYYFATSDNDEWVFTADE